MEWKTLKFSDIAEVNPKKDFGKLEQSTEVSFVPMGSVDEITGVIAERRTRKLKEVAKGYTFFREGDVIFAKITPCMENGKCAIAEGLVNGFGFGSTEFYVLRPKNNISSRYLWHYLRQEKIRNAAEGNFTGAAGQKRVPKGFIENLEIPVPFQNGKPDLTEQKRVTDELDILFIEIEQSEKGVRRSDVLAKALFASHLNNFFDAENDSRLEKIELGSLCNIAGGSGFPHSHQGRKEEKYPFYKVGDMNTEGNEVYMIKHNHSISDKDVKSLKVKIYPEGTIIFPKIGGAIATNKKRILSVPSAVDNNVMALIPNKDVCSEYLYSYFLNFNLSDWANKSALPSIRKSDVEKTLVPVPMKDKKPDYSLQMYLADNIKIFQEKTLSIGYISKKSLETFGRFRQSVLSDAFFHST